MRAIAHRGAPRACTQAGRAKQQGRESCVVQQRARCLLPPLLQHAGCRRRSSTLRQPAPADRRPAAGARFTRRPVRQQSRAARARLGRRSSRCSPAGPMGAPSAAPHASTQGKQGWLLPAAWPGKAALQRAGGQLSGGGASAGASGSPSGGKRSPLRAPAGSRGLVSRRQAACLWALLAAGALITALPALVHLAGPDRGLRGLAARALLPPPCPTAAAAAAPAAAAADAPVLSSAPEASAQQQVRAVSPAVASRLLALHPAPAPLTTHARSPGCSACARPGPPRCCPETRRGAV